MKTKLIRITTVPVSLKILLKGQYLYFSQYFEVVGISSPGKELDEVGETEGIRVVPVKMKRRISLMNDVISLLRLYLLIRKEKPQIVHTHTPKAGTLGMIAGWLARVPVRLHTVAGLVLMEEKGFKRKLLDIVEKITYSCATKVYPNSFGLMDFIVQNKFCSLGKLKVIGNGSSNGIDTTYFSPEQVSVETKAELKKKLHIETDDFVFVFVGRLVADKGINELVKAFNAVNKTHPYTKLLLVGIRESELDPLNRETELILNNHPAIIQTGYQSDVRSFLKIADVLTFPSYREGFPNVVMQAGAMGLPVIVTDINGCNEIIINGENGIIIPSKDDAALMEAMQYFAEQPEEVKHMAANARPLITSRFEQQLVWEALLMEYKMLEKEYLNKNV